MLVLQGFQLPVEAVVLGVGDLRRVIYVVAAVVVTDLLAQILYLSPNVDASGHARIIRTHPPTPKGVYSCAPARSAPPGPADRYRIVMGPWPKVYLPVAVP